MAIYKEELHAVLPRAAKTVGRLMQAPAWVAPINRMSPWPEILGDFTRHDRRCCTIHNLAKLARLRPANYQDIRCIVGQSVTG